MPKFRFWQWQWQEPPLPHTQAMSIKPVLTSVSCPVALGLTEVVQLCLQP